MAEHHAAIQWDRGNQHFLDNRYSRRHRMVFDGGAELVGSSSPHVVPLPMSDAAAVDPEEMLVGSLSSCHMLWFLSIAAAQGFCVDRYADAAVGSMQRDADGRWMMGRVTLRPEVEFSGARRPTSTEIHALHHQAHCECFIANSVRTEVVCEPVIAENASPDRAFG